MIIRVLCYALVAWVANGWSADKFLSSCLEKMKENASNLKSMRAEMVQRIEVGGRTTEQKAFVKYLISDRFYSRMEIESPMGKMTMLCRGDTTFVKVGSGTWNTQLQACNDNPLMSAYETLKNLPLVYQKDSSGVRIYKNSQDSTRYVLETTTCRLVRMDILQEGLMGTSTLQYHKYGSVDLPVHIETTVPGQAHSAMEYKSVSINSGITKTFFQLD